MAKKERRADVWVKYYLVVKATGITELEDEYPIYATQKDYNRIKESYESGKYKQLHEDKELFDIYDRVDGDTRTSFFQYIYVDYPQVVIDGKTFDQVYDEYIAAEEAFKQMANKKDDEELW